MSVKKPENLWLRWENEVKKFRKSLKHAPPDTTTRQWQRYLMFVFMQELSKNVLNENESIDSIMDRIIEALQVACGFRRVRFYCVVEKDENKVVLKLKKISRGHGTVRIGKKLEEYYGNDDAINTLLDEEPLIVDDSEKLTLKCRKELKLGGPGPYAAIPLVVAKDPFGIICADVVSPKISSESSHKVNYIEYKEHFDTFARTIMAAIENRNIFEQRNQKIKQFELVKEFNERIEAETDREKLLNSFIEHCVKLVKADGGHLKIYNKHTEKLERVADFGADVAPTDIKSKPSGVGFSNHVFQTRDALRINDVTKHPTMIEHKKFCKEKGYHEYLKILRHRRSALIVPLLKHTGEIYGVLDLHSSNKNQFNEVDKENLLAMASSVTYAVDKTQQLEHRDEFVAMQDVLLEMLKEAIGKAHCYECVLEIIRKNCRRLLKGKKPEVVCLAIKNPLTNELMVPLVKCSRADMKNKNCDLCFTGNPIFKKVLDKGEALYGTNNDLAFPIRLENEVIGVLYLQGKDGIVLTVDEERIFVTVTSTAAILITTAKNYEEKVKQSEAFCEACKLSNKTRDFKEWFTPVMNEVLNIIGMQNRNFHLVMVEKGDKDEKKLFVRATSPLFKEGMEISVKKPLLNLKLPMDTSLSGKVTKTKQSQIIFDIYKNNQRKEDDPKRLPYYRYTDEVKSEVGIPLIIQEGDIEKVIGVVIIDSTLPNDFRESDLNFYETIANYLAVAIHNQQLYEDRAESQQELSRKDRSVSIDTILRLFFHEFKKPMENMASRISNIEDMLTIEGKSIEINREDIDYLDEQLFREREIFNQLLNAFAKKSRELEKKFTRDLIQESIIAIEKTMGFDMDLKGNYQEVNYKINCYPDDIRLAFRAIISNAIKFSNELDRDERYLNIDIIFDKMSQFIYISFDSSTIEQINDEKKKSIFKFFERGTEKEGGEGLGLSIADLCVRRHGGEIEVENVRDDAVKFIVKIPTQIHYIGGLQ